MTLFLNHAIPRPTYIPMTAWLRHGPFAMWLVKAARPKRIVELGSHYGYSYFCFCEAVRQANLETRCFAVDTWQGDEHSGFYGDEVFARVQAENAAYGAFSTLLRKTFAEALADIADGSVDLLHVDGRHFYEDVKEDYESWIPKLAETAIVLFHDTEVRERDFGVWRYWAELAAREPSFNFTYQHGLGVLFRGGDLSPELASFRALTQEPAGRDALEALFHAEGEALAADHTQGFLADVLKDGAGKLAENLRALDSVPAESQVCRPAPGAAAAAEALLQAATDLDRRSSELSESRAEREKLIRDAAHLQAQVLDLQGQTAGLRKELARTRSNPIRAWKESKVHRALTLLAGSRLPISERARSRFARSARKRDPNRSLFDVQFAPGQAPLAAEAPLPVSTGSAQTLKGKVARDPSRANVLVVAHEASFTGAPILAQNIMRVLAERYNVYAVTIKGGDLIAPILDSTVETVIAGRHPERGSGVYRYLARFLSALDLDFAVVNSIEARRLLPILEELDVPNLALIHEFASYTRPRTAFDEVVIHADEIVFSSPLTLENAAEAAGMELAPNIHVFPQGKCTVPGRGDEVVDGIERQRLRAHLRPDGHEDDFVVIGAGHVQIRKGCDLFIEVARQLQAKTQGRRVRFVWIGAGYDPEHELAYSVYLQDQLKRSGMAETVRFLPPTTEIEYAYGLADVLLLPSRLDPLPNVAIDAMLAGTPVLCFDSATGIADVLREAGLGPDCVAAYLDPADMSAKLAALAASPAHHADIARRTRSHAEAIFEMTGYVARLESLILSTKARKAAQPADIEAIRKEASFDPRYVARSDTPADGGQTAAEQYLRVLAHGPLPRRPEPGFNPHVYALHRGNEGAYSFERDAYADFLAAGRPAGPWILPVLRADPDTQPSPAASALRTALHIHAYYVDQLATILDHLGANRSRPDLHVTVTGEAERKEALAILEGYDGVHRVDMVPNVGRDIGPFLTGAGARLVAGYDVVGHVHTKKSAALADEALVANWRQFLYENTLGGRIGGATLDRILNAFADDPKLGIVFPSDPNLLYWSRNRGPAAQLAERLGVGPLPKFFDFPVGTMFWMRADALRPFVDLGLELDDYPAEPVAYDGTLLHAVERLFGVVPVLRGFGAAVTAAQGLTR